MTIYNQIKKLDNTPEDINLNDLKNTLIAEQWLVSHPCFLNNFKNFTYYYQVLVDTNGVKNDDNSKNTIIDFWWEVSVFEEIKDILQGRCLESPLEHSVLAFEFASKSYEEGLVILAEKVFDYFGSYTNEQRNIAMGNISRLDVLTWETLKSKYVKMRTDLENYYNTLF